MELTAIELLTLCRAGTVGLDGIWNGGSNYRYEGASTAVVDRLLTGGYLRGKSTRRGHYSPVLTPKGWIKIAEWLDVWGDNLDMWVEPELANFSPFRRSKEYAKYAGNRNEGEDGNE